MIGRIVYFGTNHFKVEYKGKVIKVFWKGKSAVVNGKRVKMEKLEEEIKKIAGEGKEEGYEITFDQGEIRIRPSKETSLSIKRVHNRMRIETVIITRFKNEQAYIHERNFDIDFLDDMEMLEKGIKYARYYGRIFKSYEEFDKLLRIARVCKNIINGKRPKIGDAKLEDHDLIVSKRYIVVKRTENIAEEIVLKGRVSENPKASLTWHFNKLLKLIDKYPEQIGRTLVWLAKRGDEIAKEMLLKNEKLKKWAIELW